MKKFLLIGGCLVSLVAVGAGCAESGMSDEEVAQRVASAVQREDARSDRAQTAAVAEARAQVKQTMKHRADRRAKSARKAGYASGSEAAVAEAAAATEAAPADTSAQAALGCAEDWSGCTAGYDDGTYDANGNYTPPANSIETGGTTAQEDSWSEGGDGSHDPEGYATGEGCSDNPADPQPAC